MRQEGGAAAKACSAIGFHRWRSRPRLVEPEAAAIALPSKRHWCARGQCLLM